MLDTTLFESYLDGDLNAKNLITQIIEKDITASVSSISIYDVWRNPRLTRHMEINCVALLTFIEQVALTSEASRLAGIWLRSIDIHDERLLSCALVAAEANLRSEPICTRNNDLYANFNVETKNF